MLIQWHIPMGYKVRDGSITVYEEHRELVNRIFQAYDSGESAAGIARQLKTEGIKNAKGKVSWSHAGIGKILENRQYLGTEYYPRIINEDLFERVQERREQVRIKRGSGKYRPGKNERNLFGGILVCAACGREYSYIQPHNKMRSGGSAKWQCINYYYRKKTDCAGGNLTDEQVKKLCVSVINMVIQNRNLICRKEQEISNLSIRYSEQGQSLKQKKEDRSRTTEDVIKIIYKKAEERYRTLEIRDTDYRTKEMEQALDGREELKEFDEELYRKLIGKIVVFKDGFVKVVFHNGSEITVEVD